MKSSLFFYSFCSRVIEIQNSCLIVTMSVIRPWLWGSDICSWFGHLVPEKLHVTGFVAGPWFQPERVCFRNRKFRSSSRTFRFSSPVTIHIDPHSFKMAAIVFEKKGNDDVIKLKKSGYRKTALNVTFDWQISGTQRDNEDRCAFYHSSVINVDLCCCVFVGLGVVHWIFREI